MEMKKWILMCFVVLLICAACNSAMRDGTTTGALKAGMPNTLALPNGEMVYDLSGEWDIVTNVSSYATFKGVIDMRQDGNQFVGTLQSGDFPGLETSEKIKGKLKSNDIDVIQFNTVHGWVYSSGEIAEGGKMLRINTQSPSEGWDIRSTLKKK
jgi:hypothetical protein